MSFFLHGTLSDVFNFIKLNTMSKGSTSKPAPAPKPNPNYPATTGNPSGKGRGNTPKGK